MLREIYVICSNSRHSPYTQTSLLCEYGAFESLEEARYLAGSLNDDARTVGQQPDYSVVGLYLKPYEAESASMFRIISAESAEDGLGGPDDRQGLSEEPPWEQLELPHLGFGDRSTQDELDELYEPYP